MTKSTALLEAEIGMLKTRIIALEENYSFLAMYFTLRAAERLLEWEKTHRELGELEEAKACLFASGHVQEMAEEYHGKSQVGIGDIT